MKTRLKKLFGTRKQHRNTLKDIAFVYDTAQGLFYESQPITQAQLERLVQEKSYVLVVFEPEPEPAPESAVF